MNTTKTFFSKPSKAFWYAQLAAFTSDLVINFTLDYLFRETDIRLVIFADVFMFFTGIIVTYFYRQILVYFDLLSRDLKRTIINIAVSTVVLALVLSMFNAFYLYLYHQNFDPSGTIYKTEFNKLLYLRLYNAWQLFCLGWVAAYFGYNFFQNYRLSEIERWKYYFMASEAKLIALRAQIQPHFLFNCLNNISSLTMEDNVKAKKMIQHLSGLLRKSMRFTEQKFILLSEELDMVNDYLQLQSIHFEEKLTYEIQIDERGKDLKIPPLTLQVLIENAIVHGLEKNADGGKITVRLNIEGHAAFIRVCNTGKKNSEFVAGTGLNNILSRLKMMYSENVTFHLAEMPDSQLVCATLTIPDIQMVEK